ncbi:SET domain-containing protein [Aureococcus anophagefferens]|nr:SET domain-containing protein [Aureococcus anophagefferens]
MDDDAFSLDDYLEAHAPTDQSDALVLVHRDERTRWAFAQSLPPPRTLARASSSASIVDVGAGVGVGLFASRGVGSGAVVAAAPSRAPRRRRVLRRRRRGPRRAAAQRPSVCDEELREVGVALYPREITAANHSCAPTIWPRFARAPGAPPTLEYVALRSLEPGAELCHEYLDLATPDRRAALRRGYGFQCACAVCVGGGPSLDGVRARRGAMEAAIAARDWPAAAREAEALAHLEDRFRHAVLAKIRLDTSHGRGSALAREAADLVRDLDDDEADFDWRAAVPRRGG